MLQLVTVHNELFSLNWLFIIGWQDTYVFCISQVLHLAVDCVDGCEDDENIYEPVSFSNSNISIVFQDFVRN